MIPQNMYSMLPHKQTMSPPPRILLFNFFCQWNDGMLGAGKLQVWKKWASIRQGLSPVGAITSDQEAGINTQGPAGLNLLFGAIRSSHEVYQLGSGFRSRTSMGWPGEAKPGVRLFGIIFTLKLIRSRSRTRRNKKPYHPVGPF
jgi:hypothetical protein